MNPLKMTRIIEGVHNCAINWVDVKRGEEVLIITDTSCDFTNAEAVAIVCNEVGAKVTTVIIPKQTMPNQEPPPSVAAAMKVADVIFAPLNYTISHTDSRFDANAAGARYMGMYASTTTEALESEGARFPAEIIFKVTQKVAKQWCNGKRITITCDKGTNVTAEIRNPDENVVGWHATAAPLATFAEGADSWMNKFGNFAGGFGVVGVWPEWTAEGVMYYDAAHTFKGRLKTPLKFEISKGRVVNMEGDPEVVDFFRSLPEKFGPDSHHIGEFMIGLNPKTRIEESLADGTHMEAHRHAGALHTAVGMSVDRNRTVNPGIHLDQWIQRPTIYIDDEICVEKGNLRVYYDDPEILELLDKYDITL